jgi:hypothetical protein
VLQPLGTCGAANRSLSARKRFVHSQFKNPKLRYLRAFRKRKNEGLSGQNGLLLGLKAGKKLGLPLLILQQAKNASY